MTVNYYASVRRLPGGIGSDTYRKEKLAMRKIPAAGVRWQMGSPSWQLGRTANDETLRWVTLSEDYYVAVFELTQGQYLRLLRSVTTNASVSDTSNTACNPNYDKELCPVSYNTRETWRGSASSYQWPQNGHTVYGSSFIGRLRTHTGFDFDMPTLAQWEYACRAGQSAAIYNGKELHATSGNDSSLTNIAWHSSHSLDGLNKKAPVGLLEPNAWGLYDMLGNVWEYALDRHSSSARPATDVADPTGPSTGSDYKQAGGSFGQNCTKSRCAANRGVSASSNGTDYGLRLCCPVNKTWKFAVTPAE
jgi:formylglycine-generating enzyme required for sulfatase activity